jgi:DNA-binding response OmpR family regulator
MFKVLTIDDDPAMTELLTLVLKTHGLDAYMANSGEKGLQMIHKLSPDVVILDLMMPGMDGWQVCTQVRSTAPVWLPEPWMAGQTITWSSRYPAEYWLPT